MSKYTPIYVPDKLRKYFHAYEDLLGVLCSECDVESSEGFIIKWYYSIHRAESEVNALNWLRSVGYGPMTFGMQHREQGQILGTHCYHGVEVERCRVLDRDEPGIHDKVQDWMESMRKELYRILQTHITDFHVGNIGMADDGRLLIIDGGVILSNREAFGDIITF